jgi:hypothetical protein
MLVAGLALLGVALYYTYLTRIAGLSRTDTFMPMKPAMPDRTAPIRKPMPTLRPRNQARSSSSWAASAPSPTASSPSTTSCGAMPARSACRRSHGERPFSRRGPPSLVSGGRATARIRVHSRAKLPTRAQMLPSFVLLIILGGLCAVAYGIVTINDVMRRDAGTQRMQER